MKGMKQKAAKSTKERLKELEVAVQNSVMAVQMQQMMVKHLTNQVSALQQDLSGVMGMSNDFQYRTLAMLELGDFNKDDINAKAEEFKLKDFTKASDKEDIIKKYLLDETGIIKEDSIVIISSSTPDIEDDLGIFRSKFSMTECQTPDLREKLLKSKVGDIFDTEIQGVDHKVEVLGLRYVEPVEEEVKSTEPVD